MTYDKITRLRELNELLRLKIIGIGACTFFAIAFAISQALVSDPVGSEIIFTLGLLSTVGQISFSVSAVKTAVKSKKVRESL